MVSKSIIIKVAAAIFSLSISFIAAEKLLAGFFPQPLVSRLTTGFPNCFAESDYLPFTLKPNCTSRHQSTDFSVSVTTNSLGFRNTEFPVDKPKSEYRILIVGDSMAFGHGVELNQTFSQILESKLENTRVINAGFAAGFSPDSYYLFLKKNIHKLKPDMVVFTIFPFNDITDLKDNTLWTQTDNSGLPTKIIDSHRTVSADGYLIEKNIPIYYRSKILGNNHLFVLLGKTSSQLVGKISGRLHPPQKPDKTALDYYLCIFHNQCFSRMNDLFTKTEELILAAKRLTEENGSKFSLLILPADVQIDENAWEKYHAGKFGINDPPYPQTKFNQFAAGESINIIDPLPSFLKHKDKQLFFPNDGHINPESHELVAETLLTNLSLSHTILP